MSGNWQKPYWKILSKLSLTNCAVRNSYWWQGQLLIGGFRPFSPKCSMHLTSLFVTPYNSPSSWQRSSKMLPQHNHTKSFGKKTSTDTSCSLSLIWWAQESKTTLPLSLFTWPEWISNGTRLKTLRQYCQESKWIPLARTSKINQQVRSEAWYSQWVFTGISGHFSPPMAFQHGSEAERQASPRQGCVLSLALEVPPSFNPQG